MKKRRWLLSGMMVMGWLLMVSGLAGAGNLVNLLALQEGALPLIEPASYGGWEPVYLLDDHPGSGWACEQGKTADNVFVFELPAAAILERFEFDNFSVDTEGAAAKSVVVEVSDGSKNDGYAVVLKTDLKDSTDNQVFPAAAKKAGRWIRLTIHGNYGSPEYTELFSFRGYGERPAVKEGPEASGTFDTDYSLFHIRQQGSSLMGCYEYNEGLLEGSIEGRVMKLTWREGDRRGPAIFVLSADGGSFKGYWWENTDKGVSPSGSWDGRKKSSTVGGCPHWAGSVGGKIQSELSAGGRTRLYGILFDIDSDVIRPQSNTVLDELQKTLQANPDWQLTIEGHTDNTGGDAHNQTLSEKRAKSVKTALVNRGIKAERLQAAGYGSSKPVADNATELGRAQNRRVELVRK